MTYQEFKLQLDELKQSYPQYINTNIYNNAVYYVTVKGALKSEVMQDIKLYLMEKIKPCNVTESIKLVERIENA